MSKVRLIYEPDEANDLNEAVRLLRKYEIKFATARAWAPSGTAIVFALPRDAMIRVYNEHSYTRGTYQAFTIVRDDGGFSDVDHAPCQFVDLM